MIAPRLLKVVVVDDEKPARDLLASLLRQDPEVELVGSCASGAAALDLLSGRPVDLLFLDIQMPGLDGFDVVRKLEGDRVPRVVFVTAHDDFAVEAFEVHALDYLLKPFPKKRLMETLRRAKLQFQTKAWMEQNRRLQILVDSSGSRGAKGFLEEFKVQTGSRLQLVPVSRIIRLESADHYTRLYSDGGTHLVLRTMASLERDLDPEWFVRIHRTKIVNLAHVVSVHSESGVYSVQLSDKSRHPISRSRREVLSRVLKSTP